MPPIESPEASRVALYARTLVRDPDNYLEVQVDALHEYARRRGLEPTREYFEVDGARGQFHEMMQDAAGEAPPFRQVLVYNMSRLCRWPEGLRALRDRLEANGVELVSVTDHFE